MKILENVSLKLYSTMRLGGNARYLCEIHSEAELEQALNYALQHSLKHRVIGSGSNIVWQDSGYDGLVIVNKIESFDVLSDGMSICVGSGTNWDDVVQKAVDIGLSGIEFLSLIPGTAGATPVQNVGAYGCEIKDVLTKVRAYDTLDKCFVDFDNESCGFGYRTSRFKTTDAGRYVITSITLKLSNQLPQPPFYESLQTYLNEARITDFNPTSIRDAVIAIRSSKMPDPSCVANNGSFFANPIVSAFEFARLQVEFPTIKGWPYDDGVKIAAGWLVEQAGFNDYHDTSTGMATWAKQNLVLVNENAHSTADLLEFKQKIVDAVQDKFGVTLVQEPGAFALISVKKIAQAVWNFALLHEKLTGAFVGLVMLGVTGLIWCNAYVGSFGVYIAEPSKIRTMEIKTGIVFGSGITKDGKPYKELQGRLDVAADELANNTIQQLLLTGDNRFKNYDEPTAMKNYLVDVRHVDASKLTLDFAGRSTYESCERASRIFSVKQAVLFSAPSHLPRAIFTCRKFGVEAYGIAAGANANNAGRREFLARIKAIFNIYVNGENTILGPKITL